MNEILRHFIPKHENGQEPVISREPFDAVYPDSCPELAEGRVEGLRTSPVTEKSL